MLSAIHPEFLMLLQWGELRINNLRSFLRSRSRVKIVVT